MSFPCTPPIYHTPIKCFPFPSPFYKALIPRFSKNFLSLQSAIVKTARADQIKEKADNCARVKGSPKRNIPRSKVMDGEIYWQNPRTFSGRSLAPMEKSTRGVAVTAPAPIRNTAVRRSSTVKCPIPSFPREST